jgi:hypothetical protein
MPRPTLIVIWSLLACSLAVGLEVTVTHGNRAIGSGWSPPPPELVEGSVWTTFTGDGAMDSVGTVPGLERVNGTTWRYRFAWDEIQPRTFVFRDASDGVCEVTTVPSWPSYDSADHAVPVIMIDTPVDSLWDPATGIYVWGDGVEPNWDQRGDAWERDALLRWYDPDGVLRHQRTVGLRINGNWSRTLSQKSLRLYFDHHGDPEVVVDRFFGPELEEHERLLLRGGASNAHLFVRDVVCCEIMSGLGHPVSRWRPVSTYLNGEPWGLYHLRERPDGSYAERQLGLSGDYDFVKDYEGEHPGDFDQWRGFQAAVYEYPDPADHDFFRLLEASLDLVSYVDWALLQIWSASADNGGAANRIVYRPEGGRWRFMIYDEDAAFHPNNRDHDYFRFFASTTESEYENRRPPSWYQDYYTVSRAFRFFDAFTRNASARRVLRERWELHAAGALSPAAVATAVDDVVSALQPAEVFHDERWDLSSSFADQGHAIDTFVAARVPIVDAHLAAFLAERMDPVEVDAFATEGDDTGAVALTWHTHREIGLVGWIVERRRGTDAPWEQIADHTTHPELVGQGGPATEASYVFHDTALAGEALAYRLRWVSQDAGTITVPWIEPVDWPDAPPAAVVVNEFLARNDEGIQDETGAREDWLEIHNPEDVAVDLTGYYLSDDPAEPLKWAFPAGITVPAGGFLLVWCDDDEQDGPLHASFKLATDGESVGIYTLRDGAVAVVDEHAFGPQAPDVSEGRAPDGAAHWIALPSPTPGASNGAIAVGDAPVAATSIAAFPNPFNPRCTITYTVNRRGPVRLSIHDVAGRRLRELVSAVRPPGLHQAIWDGTDRRGASVSSGVYHAVIHTPAGSATCKLGLVR